MRRGITVKSTCGTRDTPVTRASSPCHFALLITGILVCACASARAAKVIAVSADARDSLTDAISKAQAGDEIRLAPGTYKFDKPVRLEAKGTEAQPIHIEPQGPDRPVFDFSGEPEEKSANGIEVKGDYWQVVGIDVAHAGSHGIYVTGSHNTIERCLTHENRDSGTQIAPGGSYNLIVNCESFRNFDPKTKGENADGFAAKHEIGPGNVFRGCRSYQNADDGWDFWMAPHPILIEDCVAYRNGYNIWKIADYQGDGNGFKFGGNYVATPHIARRCVSIENPLHGFDQNHNVGGITVEDCIAIR